jgi:hypothetical protein
VVLPAVMSGQFKVAEAPASLLGGKAPDKAPGDAPDKAPDNAKPGGVLVAVAVAVARWARVAGGELKGQRIKMRLRGAGNTVVVKTLGEA